MFFCILYIYTISCSMVINFPKKTPKNSVTDALCNYKQLRDAISTYQSFLIRIQTGFTAISFVFSFLLVSWIYMIFILIKLCLNSQKEGVQNFKIFKLFRFIYLFRWQEFSSYYYRISTLTIFKSWIFFIKFQDFKRMLYFVFGVVFVVVLYEWQLSFDFF